MLKRPWSGLRQFMGFPNSGYRAGEQLLASLGGLLGILLVLLVTRQLLGMQAALIVVPSLGASAVLIFAIPHSPLTQPWAVLGGHLVSALVGVSCYKLIPQPLLAAGLAVGLAIGAMHLARCIHPPGGATALTAVIGGASVNSLGYAYALTPVAINCVIMLIVGLLFNYAFPWRRYPVSLMRYAAPLKKAHAWPTISTRHIEEAIEHLKVVVDISPTELGEIIEQAMQIAQAPAAMGLPDVRLGGIYCNDLPGPEWSVRKVVDERVSGNPDFDLVIYQVLEGPGKARQGSCTRREFSRWIGSERHPK